MNHSVEIKEIALALNKAQSEMQPAIKVSNNPFHKTKYADLLSVWEVAQPALAKNGLSVIHVGDMCEGKPVLVTILAHTSGQYIKSILPMYLVKQDSQGVGSCMTYLRRYGLAAIMGIVCDNDDDANLADNKLTKPTVAKAVQIQDVKAEIPLDRITFDQYTEFLALKEKVDDVTKANMQAYLRITCKVEHEEQMPVGVFITCMAAMNKNLQMKRITNEVCAA